MGTGVLGGGQGGQMGSEMLRGERFKKVLGFRVSSSRVWGLRVQRRCGAGGRRVERGLGIRVWVWGFRLQRRCGVRGRRGEWGRREERAREGRWARGATGRGEERADGIRGAAAWRCRSEGWGGWKVPTSES